MSWFEPLIDPIPFIRSRPERFVKQLPVHPHELASNLVGDAVLLTHVPATMCRGDRGWWIVGCEADWLAAGESAAAPLQAFHRMMAFPQAGANSIRGEVLLTAFAEAVVSIGPEGRSHVIGDVDESDRIWADMKRHTSWRRSVAFRLPTRRA